MATFTCVMRSSCIPRIILLPGLLFLLQACTSSFWTNSPPPGDDPPQEYYSTFPGKFENDILPYMVFLHADYFAFLLHPQTPAEETANYSQSLANQWDELQSQYSFRPASSDGLRAERLPITPGVYAIVITFPNPSNMDELYYAGILFDKNRNIRYAIHAMLENTYYRKRASFCEWSSDWQYIDYSISGPADKDLFLSLLYSNIYLNPLPPPPLDERPPEPILYTSTIYDTDWGAYDFDTFDFFYPSFFFWGASYRSSSLIGVPLPPPNIGTPQKPPHHHHPRPPFLRPRDKAPPGRHPPYHPDFNRDKDPGKPFLRPRPRHPAPHQEDRPRPPVINDEKPRHPRPNPPPSEWSPTKPPSKPPSSHKPNPPPSPKPRPPKNPPPSQSGDDRKFRPPPSSPPKAEPPSRPQRRPEPRSSEDSSSRPRVRLPSPPRQNHTPRTERPAARPRENVSPPPRPERRPSEPTARPARERPSRSESPPPRARSESPRPKPSSPPADNSKDDQNNPSRRSRR